MLVRVAWAGRSEIIAVADNSECVVRPGFLDPIGLPQCLDFIEAFEEIALVRVGTVASLSDDRRGPRPLQELDDITDGVVAVQGGAADISVATACEQRNDAFGPAWEPDGDALSSDDAMLREVLGKGVGQTDELPIRQIAVSAAHRNTFRIAVGTIPDEAIDRVVPPMPGPIIFLIPIDMEQCQQRI